MLNGRFATLRTSLYAYDATIFLAPNTKDVDALTNILHNFGLVTGLQTNLQKSIMAPISCDDIDLDPFLQNFPAMRSAFPLKYLGLPLSLKCPYNLWWTKQPIAWPAGRDVS